MTRPRVKTNVSISRALEEHDRGPFRAHPFRRNVVLRDSERILFLNEEQRFRFLKAQRTERKMLRQGTKAMLAAGLRARHVHKVVAA